VVTVFRVLGQVLGGLTIIACAIGWASWVWLSGAPWLPERRRRRWLTRPLRATLQSAASAVVLGVVVAPLLTATVLATLGTTLVVTAGGWRLRLWLDRRADLRADARAREVTVVIGEPIPNRPRPAAGDPRRPDPRALEPAR